MENVKEEIDDHTLQDLYAWVDKIPFTRPKRNLSRDFSDGVLMAEVVAHYYPRMVDMHNYSPANSVKQKVDNWRVLNRKVFRRFEFELSEDVLTQITNCKPLVIERVLLLVRSKLEHSELPPAAIAALPSNSGGGDSSNGSPNQYGTVLPASPVSSPGQPIFYSAPAPAAAAVYGQNGGHKASTEQVAATAGSPRKGQPVKPHAAAAAAAGNAGALSTSTKKPAAAPKTQQQQQQSFRGIAPSKHNSGDPVGIAAANAKIAVVTTATAPPVQGEVVPRIMLEEKEQQCLAQEETIQILQAKVRRLEHLLQLKDVRINDMQAQLDALRLNGNRR